MILPAVLTGFMFWRDFKDWQVVFILEHAKEGRIDLALQAAFAVLTSILVVVAMIQFSRLNAELANLEKSANKAIIRTSIAELEPSLNVVRCPTTQKA